MYTKSARKLTNAQDSQVRTKKTKFMNKNVPGGGVVETDSFARTDEAFIAPPLERAPAIEIGSEQEGAREIAFVK